MKVMMLVMMKPESFTGEQKPPSDEALRAMHDFNEEMAKAGVLVTLGGLTPPEMGKRIRTRGGKRTVIDGPFAEAKEIVAGYSILEVKSFDEAMEWAKRAPFVDGQEVDVEMRPIWDPSMFDPK
ncbi:MAG: YciI family protein [Kofleriaceae bacterium]